MKKLIIIFTLTLLSFYQVHSQTIEYKYSCGDSKATIIWNKSRENNLIYLKTTQGNEINKYVMTPDYHTISWEYSNQDKNTNIRVVLKMGLIRLMVC